MVFGGGMMQHAKIGLQVHHHVLVCRHGINNMQEYWVNVYGLDEHKAYGMTHKYKHDADMALIANRKSSVNAYRIHVKMKEVKPKYEYLNDGCIRHMQLTQFQNSV